MATNITSRKSRPYSHPKLSQKQGSEIAPRWADLPFAGCRHQPAQGATPTSSKPTPTTEEVHITVNVATHMAASAHDSSAWSMLWGVPSEESPWG
jgi:hypothetical protein